MSNQREDLYDAGPEGGPVVSFSFEEWVEEIRREYRVVEQRPDDVTIRMLVDQGFTDAMARRIMDDQVRRGLFVKLQSTTGQSGGHVNLYRPVVAYPQK